MADRRKLSFNYIGGSVAENLDGLPLSGSAVQELPGSSIRPQQVAVPKKERVIRIDLVGLAGLVMSIVMAASMLAAGLWYYQSVQARDAAQAQVRALQQEQDQLRSVYEAGYDLEEIRRMALDMGMVPIDEAKTVPIEVSTPPEELTFWQWLRDYFLELFA